MGGPSHHLSNLSNLSESSGRTSESAMEEVCQIHNDLIVAYNKKT